MRRAIVILAAMSVLLGALSGCNTQTADNSTCLNIGDACQNNLGICVETGSAGCTMRCIDFFDTTSCTAYGQACYPVYRNQFGCLGIGSNQQAAGGNCTVNNDCVAGLACYNSKCAIGCDSTHICPDGSGICQDKVGFGWKICYPAS